MPPIQRRLLIRGEEQRDEHERLEPGYVRVEPVVYGELKGDDERRGEGDEPAQRLLARHEGDEDCDEDDERCDGLLQEREPGNLGVDGPRADPVVLEGEGLLVEELYGLEGVPV